MDIKKITKEILNPALAEIASEVLKTVQEIKSGKKTYNQGLAELNGYKQVIQIMALEVMRHRVNVDASPSGRRLSYDALQER